MVEILVVTVILALAATLLGVSLRGATYAARLSAARLEIEATLRLARHESALRRRAIAILFDRQSARCGIEYSSENVVWRKLEGVEIAEIGFSGPANVGSANGVFRVQLNASGAGLPWRLVLRSGNEHRSLAWDGVSSRLRPVDDGAGSPAGGGSSAR